ncbi:hypothetical protein GCM10029992_33140 [Glycomyces albus]
MFYFEPDDQWYLVYQTGLPSFSTLDHPGAPESASPAQNFVNAHDPIVDQNSSYVVDYWVTCDDVNCYMYFSNSNQTFFRMETTVEQFPNGFGNTQVLFQSPGNNSLFEALNLYKVGDTGEYLLIIEAIGSDGNRYFRSWTADSLDALGNEWTPWPIPSPTRSPAPTTSHSPAAGGPTTSATARWSAPTPTRPWRSTPATWSTSTRAGTRPPTAWSTRSSPTGSASSTTPTPPPTAAIRVIRVIRVSLVRVVM